MPIAQVRRVMKRANDGVAKRQAVGSCRYVAAPVSLAGRCAGGGVSYARCRPAPAQPRSV